MRLSLLFLTLTLKVYAQTPSTDDLYVLNATEEQWTSGATLKGKGGKGKIYSFQVTSPFAKILAIREIVVDGVKLPFEVIKNKSRNYSGALSHRDTVLLIARFDKEKKYQKATQRFEKEKGRCYIIYEANKKSFTKYITSFSDTSQKMKNQ